MEKVKMSDILTECRTIPSMVFGMRLKSEKVKGEEPPFLQRTRRTLTVKAQIPGIDKTWELTTILYLEEQKTGLMHEAADLMYRLGFQVLKEVEELGLTIEVEEIS